MWSAFSFIFCFLPLGLILMFWYTTDTTLHLCEIAQINTVYLLSVAGSVREETKHEYICDGYLIKVPGFYV